jgi:acyl-CoA synthetase (AMP-forming)/AMP-acid ligase II
VEISDGLVRLRGRAGDQINVAGRKVSPETIERVLLKHPQVSECVVFGVPSRDAERTEEIVAVVVSREGEGALREFVLESLPAWQTPRHWWFVEAVRANARGKVSRTEWRAEFLRTRDKSV